MLYITYNTASAFICFLMALVFLFNDKDAAWRLMILFLLASLATEVLGIFMRHAVHSNLGVYNIYVVIECGFTSFFFYHLYGNYSGKLKWLLAWLAFFLVMYIAELLYNNFADFVFISATIMSVVFVLASLLYYFLKMQDDHFEPLLSSGPFWWVSGALFFYFGSTACNLFFDYLKDHDTAIYSRSVRYVVFVALNIVLYTCWSYSFICRYRQQRSSSY
ncbi:hypothetical protein [Mucilaginibacter glaciei]|uniref:Uncharacterized protein n=1 Tax=Mucilaginibacter glaciei TaxID=2772109 RepID=A0A926NP55_9SPHI|nr:hypothetical protein [Mucilaginibacter glaciei]MBD1393346.1 hypothetical protein [Mucilaginibacter glaciei]